MSNPSASTIHNLTKGGEFINSANDTNVRKSYYNLNIVFSDVTGFFHFAAKHFVAWIDSGERDPVEISDIAPPDPSSLPPVSSIADRYTRSMLECMVGYPLYNPRPFSELSMEYPRNGINIGDVGFIRRDGDFDFLFNICSPQKGFINPFNLPDGFSLETPDNSTTKVLESLPNNRCIIPRTVKITESGEYICEASEGAVLELPGGAIQNEAIKIKPFEDLAKLRGVQWYEYAMTRGRNISNGSLYVVTSFTKCTQWGIAVFDRPCGPGQGLTFVRSPLGWKGSRVFTTKVADSNQGDTPNQCVFLRGYKIMLRQDIFNSLCNDHPRRSDPALISSSPQAGSSGLSLTREPAQRMRGGGGTDILSRIRTVGKPSPWTTNSTMSNVKKSDEVVLRADFDSSPFHPSDPINAALLSQNPGAKVAIIHDDVWRDLLPDNLLTLNYETLINISRSYTSKVDEYGCVSLEKISSPSKVLHESSRRVQETETSALQEPVQGAKDDRNPDIWMPAHSAWGTETPDPQEALWGVREKRNPDSSMLAQASTALRPHPINQSLEAGDEKTSVAFLSPQAPHSTIEQYLSRDRFGPKAIEKGKVNEARDMFQLVRKSDLNVETEKRGVELYDPFENFMNKLKFILQEIPKNHRLKSTVSKTDATGIYQNPQLFSPKGDFVDISDLVPADPSLLPVASIADKYTRSMLKCMVGYPLYNPEPFGEPSAQYLRDGVHVGDVGFVRGGAFDFLFNICPTQNGITNPPNLPNGFSLKASEQSELRVTSPFPHKTRLFSRNITRTKSGEYISKGSEGAILELPEGAIQAEAINTKSFEDLAKLCGVQWYKYAMSRGRSISNGSLCLITSFTKCTQWGIAVFDRPCDLGQGLKFNKKRSIPFGKSTSKYHWNGSCGFPTKVANHSQGDATATNQCVFLRGYKIKIRQDIFDNLYNGQPQQSDPATLFSSPQLGRTSRPQHQAQRIRGG